MGFGEDIKVPKAELGQEYSSGFKRGQEFGFGELEAGQRIGEQQQRLARALQERAEGRAPSIAQMQLAQALEQQGAATQAQLASARGLSPAMAQRLALEARGQAAQSAAAQAAILRTQEQQASQALLGQQLAAMLQGRQLSAQEAAQLGGQAAEVGYRQQQLEQQRLMAEQALQQAQQQRMTRGIATGAGALLGGGQQAPLLRRRAVRMRIQLDHFFQVLAVVLAQQRQRPAAPAHPFQLGARTRERVGVVADGEPEEPEERLEHRARRHAPPEREVEAAHAVVATRVVARADLRPHEEEPALGGAIGRHEEEARPDRPRIDDARPVRQVAARTRMERAMAVRADDRRQARVGALASDEEVADRVDVALEAALRPPVHQPGARVRVEPGARLDEAREGLVAVVLGSVASAGLAIVTSTRVAAAEVAAFFSLGGGASTGVNPAWSLALLGAGHLVGLSVGMAMLTGMLIAWGVSVPILTAMGHAADGQSLAAFTTTVWRTQVRFIGAGAIAVAATCSR